MSKAKATPWIVGIGRSEHTPGPWAIPSRDSGVTVNAGSAIIAEVYPQGANTAQRANAKLIAAAPDMAEALRQISTTVAPKGSHAAIMKRIADRALAKAGL